MRREREPITTHFSHGLGGNREGSAFLGKHWAARGYIAVFLQHPGSDDSVWKDVPVAQRLAALKVAAGFKDFLLRVQDVPAVLDHEPQRPHERQHEAGIQQREDSVDAVDWNERL